ncbi:class I SAM-dependent methyltransferase [Hansschlegelia zhihuaiae]|uniref:Class I SAM-dependent methyltransferase n=1 Tax=Hansschlegelia zhihuaiae TaxID=405005 RepID=A0A4Q0MLN4_9HYPH|nr:class I SAM-dependent methyltransferase [Hansschlegelia zhihuaiae]RXF74453.1 class I SAM-dependent methyltransferase [Hansschlegelia zhihuaiae]
MTSRFDQSSYWIKRHRSLVGDPRSVGHLGKTLDQNKRSEAVMVHVVDRAVDILQPVDSVLDVGCGYGRVSGCFTSRKIRYLGVDVSPEAISQARDRNPDAEFVIGDLATWTAPRLFDIVSVLYVFVHFVDDSAWRNMVIRALSWVAPGGALLFADVFPEQRGSEAQHYVSRPLSDYLAIFSVAGFELDSSFQNKLTEDETVGAYAGHFRLARRLK